MEILNWNHRPVFRASFISDETMWEKSNHSTGSVSFRNLSLPFVLVLFTSTIHLFKSFKSQLLLIHTGLLCPLVQAGLCPRDAATRGPRQSTPTVGRRIIVSGLGGLSGFTGQRSGRSVIIMRSLFCQQLCNKAGRDREFHHLSTSWVGGLAGGCRQSGGGEGT